MLFFFFGFVVWGFLVFRFFFGFPESQKNGYFGSFVFFWFCGYLVCLIACFSCREMVLAQNLGKYCAFSDA